MAQQFTAASEHHHACGSTDVARNVAGCTLTGWINTSDGTNNMGVVRISDAGTQLRAYLRLSAGKVEGKGQPDNGVYLSRLGTDTEQVDPDADPNFSHTLVAGERRAAIVILMHELINSEEGDASATYGGTSMTRIAEAVIGTTNKAYVAIFHLGETALAAMGDGVKTVAITHSTSPDMGDLSAYAMTLQGVDQYTVPTVATGTSVSSMSQSVSLNADEWAISALVVGQVSATDWQQGQNEVHDESIGNTVQNSVGVIEGASGSETELSVNLDPSMNRAVLASVIFSPHKGSELITATGSTNVADGETHHVAAVFDYAGDLVTVYVDGVSDGSQAADWDVSASEDTAASESFLAAGYSTIHYFDGTLQDLRAYSRALNAEEIATLHAARGRDRIADAYHRWPLTERGPGAVVTAAEDIGIGRAPGTPSGTGSISRLGTDVSDEDLSVSHTLLAGTDRIAWCIGIAFTSDDASPSMTATYGGQAMTKVAEATNAVVGEGLADGFLVTTLFWIKEADLPSDGSNAFTLSVGGATLWAGSVNGGTLQGVDQTAIEDSDIHAPDEALTAIGSIAPGAGSWAFGGVGAHDNITGGTPTGYTWIEEPSGDPLVELYDVGVSPNWLRAGVAVLEGADGDETSIEVDWSGAHHAALAAFSLAVGSSTPVHVAHLVHPRATKRP